MSRIDPLVEVTGPADPNGVLDAPSRCRVCHTPCHPISGRVCDCEDRRHQPRVPFGDLPWPPANGYLTMQLNHHRKALTRLQAHYDRMAQLEDEGRMHGADEIYAEHMADMLGHDADFLGLELNDTFGATQFVRRGGDDVMAEMIRQHDPIQWPLRSFGSPKICRKCAERPIHCGCRKKDFGLDKPSADNILPW